MRYLSTVFGARQAELREKFAGPRVIRKTERDRRKSESPKGVRPLTATRESLTVGNSDATVWYVRLAEGV